MPIFYHCLFVVALIANAGVLWTSWLLTPNSKLLLSPIYPRFIWVSRIVIMLTAAFAYWSPALSVILTTMFLLLAGGYASQISIVRALGEDAYLKIAITHASEESIFKGLFYRLLPFAFYGLLAGTMFFFFPSDTTWGFYIATGIAYYALAIFASRIRIFFQLRKRGRSLPPES